MSDKGIKNGQEIQVYPLDGDGESLTLRCHDVAQRNWSRVAKAEVIDGVNAGQIYFQHSREAQDRACSRVQGPAEWAAEGWLPISRQREHQ